MAITIFVILSISLIVTGSARGEPIQKNYEHENITFSLFATDLTGCDAFSACDASVTILCSSIQSDWKICWQTGQMQNDNFPVWPDVFTFEHSPGYSQRWRLDLKEHDVLGTKLIQSFTIIVDDYAKRNIKLFQNILSKDRGILWIHRRNHFNVR